MNGEIQNKEGPERRKVRRRKKRRKRDAKAVGDVEKDKIYMVIFFAVVAAAFIGLIGWGLWAMFRNLLDVYT